MGKGEIARHEQFLLLPQCFQKACFPGTSKGVNEWEWVKPRRPCFPGVRLTGTPHNILYEPLETIVETMNIGKRGMNPAAIAFSHQY